MELKASTCVSLTTETALRRDTEFDLVLAQVQKLGIQCNAGCDSEMLRIRIKNDLLMILSLKYKTSP